MIREDIIRLAREACDKNKVDAWHNGYWTITQKELEHFAALVAAAERKWVGLTDEEFNDCLVAGDPCENLAEPEAWAVMKEVEAKLKEKNK